MNYTENYQGIRLDVQAPDFTIDEGVQLTIRNTIDKLLKHISKVTFCDVYLKIVTGSNEHDKVVSIRLGIPGPDVFAEDAGTHWEPTVRSVGEKLIRQLEKNK